MQLRTSNGKDWISLKSILPLLLVNFVSGFSLELMSDLDTISRAIRQIVWWNIAKYLLWQIPIFFVFLIFFVRFLNFFLIIYSPFLWMGFNCFKARERLWWGSLFFTTTSPEFPGTHFINLRRMKGWVDLGATQWFWTWDSWIENLLPKNFSMALWRIWLHSIQL